MTRGDKGKLFIRSVPLFTLSLFSKIVCSLCCHPPGVRKGFIKGEALRLLRTNSSKATFEQKITQFKRLLRDRSYPDNLLENALSEIKFSERMSALKNKQKTRKRILKFVTGPTEIPPICALS